MNTPQRRRNEKAPTHPPDYDDGVSNYDGDEFKTLCGRIEEILQTAKDWVRVTAIEQLTGARKEWVIDACRVVGEENFFSARYEFRWQTEFARHAHKNNTNVHAMMFAKDGEDKRTLPTYGLKSIS